MVVLGVGLRCEDWRVERVRAGERGRGEVKWRLVKCTESLGFHYRHRSDEF